jgi:beta-lactamase class A
VYPPGRRPYVLVVLTRGIADGAKSARLIADLSALVYAHNSVSLTPTRSGN